MSQRAMGRATEFVRALTLLFKRRGYKYDDRGFQDLSDKEFQEFLETARIPPAAEDLQEQVKQEIERRVREVEDRKQGPLRTALEAKLKGALKREKKSGIAEPRQVKEAELEQVVQGFGCLCRSAGRHGEALAKRVEGPLEQSDTAGTVRQSDTDPM